MFRLEEKEKKTRVRHAYGRLVKSDPLVAEFVNENTQLLCKCVLELKAILCFSADL